MTTDAATRRVLQTLDVTLRVVAPFEHPSGAAELVLSFEELELGPAVCPSVRGLSAHGLDDFAAMVRRDDSLRGRPVFAVGVDRVFAKWSREVPGAKPDHMVPLAVFDLRRTSLHELAHAVDDRQHPPAVEARRFPEWLAATLSSIGDARLGKPGTAHGPAWWRRYATLVARLEAFVPELVDWPDLQSEAVQYGYATAADARQWVAAAKTAPGFMDAPLLDLAGIPCPAFDALLDSLSPKTAADVSVAAAQS